MATLEFIDQQEELWALLRQPSAAPGRSIAIFVHGFLGDYLTTWGRLPELLRSNAQVEPELNDWDFLFVGYKTRHVVTYLDIARVIATHWERAAMGSPPFGSSYKKVALFGHSLGTLGIRQLLCAAVLQPANMLSALHSITLFGTPLNGSPLAQLGASLFGGQITDALKPGNPQLRMLRSWNQSVQKHISWQKVRVILGTDDRVVGNKYADLIDFDGDSKPSLLLNFDHLTLVKPANWNHSSIRSELLSALK